MFRRSIVVLMAAFLLLGAACHKDKKKSGSPLAGIDSKQPEKVLFDKAMEAMNNRKWEVARLNLQTLINTYPESEYIARAKMGIGDSWLKEGGAAALTQAESEYKDFITFFPNMTEAAEAQMKIGDIHFRQIDKPDRDYKHAKDAEDAFRQLLLQYPDSGQVEEARKKLLQVQEILAEREFRVGRFYYMKQASAAAVARLKTLTDTYPLYSKADEALFMLGDSYERLGKLIRTNKISQEAKDRLSREYEEQAAKAYSRIITRYPAMPRAGDAAKRLQALNRPVPKATPEAIEANKREKASRDQLGHVGRAKLMMRRKPDFRPAATVGQPTLTDPPTTAASTLVQNANQVARDTKPGAKAGEGKVDVQTVPSSPVENQPVPRTPESKPAETGKAASDSPAAAPQQVNEVRPAQPGDSQPPQDSSSSKQRKRSGLRRMIPF